jgi:hypothetical protein
VLTAATTTTECLGLFGDALLSALQSQTTMRRFLPSEELTSLADASGAFEALCTRH